MTDPSPPLSRPPFAGVLDGLPPAAWRRLDDLALIRARGAEARGFLQSQLSNDVSQVTAARAQLSGYCSPKGRLLAVFTVAQLESPDSLGLELPAELLPGTLKRLRMFVLRSKLLLEDASPEWPSLGLAGVGAGELLRGLRLEVPDEPMTSVDSDGVQVLRRPGDWPRYRLRAAPERLADLEQSLTTLPQLVTNHWSLGELLAGVPAVRAATSEHFVPQTVDLDLAGGVSFSKGCYPGQEIVARVHYLGRLKQRLHLARSEQTVEPGQTVRLAGDSGQAVGEIMDVAELPGGGQLLALALQLERPDGAELQVGDGPGPRLTALSPAH